MKFGPGVFRRENWGIYAKFDRKGNCLSRSCGPIRDSLFTMIFIRRIEEECRKIGRDMKNGVLF